MMRTFMLAVLMLVSACTAREPPRQPDADPQDVAAGAAAGEEVLQIIGTVRHLDIEGGQYVIRDAEGTNYSPMNLDAQFRVDGLAVEVEARRRSDVMSIGMSGSIIEVLRIRRAEKQPAPGTASALTGLWTVVGHSIPGISAMDDSAARGWYGRTVRLTEAEAISAEARCDAPGYATRLVPKETLLRDEYRIAPAALPLLAGTEQLRVLDVSCGGQSWNAFGNRLIASGERALASWDGVFFELVRDRDFRAVGQEPGWLLQLRKGKEIHFAWDYAMHEATLPAPIPVTQAGAVVYHVATGEHDLRVTLTPKPCTDSMSGKPFETTVTLLFDGRQLEGCGSTLP